MIVPSQSACMYDCRSHVIETDRHLVMRALRSKRLRAALWIAADGKCQRCGEELLEGWHADHIEPWSETGRTNVHEMQALCAKCNLKKGANK
jgi:5-methylcytosine-specific restriction endonuclease McrA